LQLDNHGSSVFLVDKPKGQALRPALMGTLRSRPDPTVSVPKKVWELGIEL